VSFTSGTVGGSGGTSDRAVSWRPRLSRSTPKTWAPVQASEKVNRPGAGLVCAAWRSTFWSRAATAQTLGDRHGQLHRSARQPNPRPWAPTGPYTDQHQNFSL